jgi:predicted phage terminase large subunit-like protein
LDQKATDPRPPVLWQAHPGPQFRFTTSRAHEVLYGGAAGGGKSAGLIAIPLRWVTNPHFSALILRRDTTQLGDLLKKARGIYPSKLLGGRAKADGASVTWRFPSGASVRFTHCQHEDDVARFDGWEFSLVEFDELTHFTEKQYLGVRARIRSPHPGLPRYTRSTTNPGGEGHVWVFARWGAWLDPHFRIKGLPAGEGGKPPAAPGQVLWFVKRGGAEICVQEGETGDNNAPAMSRTFIPARLADNPSLAVNDPTYASTLASLDSVRRAQLEDGNWLVSYSAGSLFRKEWFRYLDAPPVDVEARVRRWDFAATEPNDSNRDPDWTRGVLMSKTKDGRFVVEDVESIRGRPAAVENLVLETAIRDGVNVQIRIPEDPGSAGKVVAARYVSLLGGFDVHAERETGDKVTRARPLSAQAEAGNVLLVRGSWNRGFVEELESFPTAGVHDDQVDGASGAFSSLQPTSDAEALERRLAAYQQIR